MTGFRPRTRAELVREIERLGLDIPLADHTDMLLRPLRIGQTEIPNRLCALPMIGDDANPDGSPSALTVRRYQRYARGGFGIVWFEATAMGASPEAPGRLCLQDAGIDAFARCVDALRVLSPGALLILQLWPDARPIEQAYAMAAARAGQAGFDGVDIACCHGNALASGLVGGVEKLLGIVRRVRAACPDIMTTVRLDAYQARTGGFGVDADDYRRPDPAAPVALAHELHREGVRLLSVNIHSPNLFGDPLRRGNEPLPDGADPHEHPLTVLARGQDIGRRIREAVPGLTVVGGGYSRLGPFAAGTAAAAIREGAADVIGLGRLALLDAAGRGLSPGMCSLLPFAEADLWIDGGPFGRIPAHSAADRDRRLLILDDVHNLVAGIDPGGSLHAGQTPPEGRRPPSADTFVVAFRKGRIDGAHRMLRESGPLPEMSAHIRSYSDDSQSEPLRQLQFMIAWTVRCQGRSGVRIPKTATGSRVAIIGAGPTGLAAATRLLEHGHRVVLYEREDRLGGAPALVYPEDRLPDPAEEIDALLQPAFAAGRLDVRLGREAWTTELLADHDAILVATGCWTERSLGALRGVWPALRFLRAARRGECTSAPSQVVILCGGDAAMDAAVVAKQLGAQRIDLLFDSSRADALWHLPEEWFESAGIHARFNTTAVEYEVGADGAVCGVVVRGGELVPAERVIEAMSLSGVVVDTSPANVFAAGAVVNGGASVEQCMREGLSAAETIDRFLQGIQR